MMKFGKWSYEILFGAPKNCKWCGSAIVKTSRPIKYNRRTGKPTKFEVTMGCAGGYPMHDRWSWTENA